MIFGQSIAPGHGSLERIFSSINFSDRLRDRILLWAADICLAASSRAPSHPVLSLATRVVLDIFISSDTIAFMADKSKFQSAFVEAYDELEKLKIQEREIFVRKAQLQKTLMALYPLIFPESEPDVNSLTLANAIRLVFSSANRALSALEVRTKLDDIGFDLSGYENPGASIHTALSRMLESQELSHAPKTERGKKTFAATPELKPVPEVEAVPESALQKALESIGIAPEEKK